MHPYLFLPLFLQMLASVQAQPISQPVPKEEPTAQVSKDPKGNVPWPGLVAVAGIPLVGWTIRQAYRNMLSRHPSPWDYYESAEEVFGELHDNDEQYQAETRRCVNEKVCLPMLWVGDDPASDEWLTIL